MISLPRFLSATALLLLAAATVRAQAISRVRHDPPRDVVRGESAPIVVVLDGQGLAEARVVLHCREPGAERFEAVTLERRSGTRWEGAIPPRFTGGLDVSYYLEATSRGALIAVGSREAPLSLRLSDPPPPSPPPSRLGLVAAAAALCVAVGTAARWVRKRRRDAVRSRVFWTRTLFPLLRLDEPRCDQQLAAMAEGGLGHPVEGWRRYPVEALQRRLEEVRRTDVGRLYREATSRGALGDGEDPGSPFQPPPRSAHETMV